MDANRRIAMTRYNMRHTSLTPAISRAFAYRRVILHKNNLDFEWHVANVLILISLILGFSRKCQLKTSLPMRGLESLTA